MVQSGKLQPNHAIIANIQDIFNRLPDTASEDVIKAFAVGTNDVALALYIANLLRTTIALHNLINTKIPKEETPEEKKKREKEEKEKKEKKEKEKEKKDEKEKK